MRATVIIAFGLLLALSLGLAAQTSTRNLLPTVPRAHAAVTIHLSGTVSSWNASGPVTNPTITVNQGDIVTIMLSSTDTLHQFALDLDRDGAKFTGSCSTGDTCSASFTPSAPPPPVTIDTTSLSGTYTYFCTIHSTMQGNFIVNTGSVGAIPIPVDKIRLVAPYLIFAALVVALVSAVIYRSRSAHRKKL